MRLSLYGDQFLLFNLFFFLFLRYIQGQDAVLECSLDVILRYGFAYIEASCEVSVVAFLTDVMTFFVLLVILRIVLCANG